MVTTSFLESKENLEKEIRHPEQWQQEGYYPNKYTITYDASTRIHSILLENLVWQN
jgi:hypothetical protein